MRGKRYFAKYENGIVCTWGYGATSWSVHRSSNISAWKMAKLAKVRNSMTAGEAIEYLTAHLECESRRSRIEGCNNNCNECELCYLQELQSNILRVLKSQYRHLKRFRSTARSAHRKNVGRLWNETMKNSDN